MDVLLGVDSLNFKNPCIKSQRDELYNNHMPVDSEYCFIYIRPIQTSGTIARWLLWLVQKSISVLPT